MNHYHRQQRHQQPLKSNSGRRPLPTIPTIPNLPYPERAGTSKFFAPGNLLPVLCAFSFSCYLFRRSHSTYGICSPHDMHVPSDTRRLIRVNAVWRGHCCRCDCVREAWNGVGDQGAATHYAARLMAAEIARIPAMSTVVARATYPPLHPPTRTHTLSRIYFSAC